MIYIVREVQECLLELAPEEPVGIIVIRPEGWKKEESVRGIHETVKEGQVVSVGQTQQEMDAAMEQIVDRHPGLF